MSSPPTSPTANPVHRFIIVIPVADRPRHIQACLDSLTELLRRYPYPRAVTVLIADDSTDAANVAANRAIAERYSSSGLAVTHFGPDEQFALIESLQETLPGVVGNAPLEHFGHKGQGVMRNIAYIKVAEMLRGPAADDTLIWSLDSDQEFCVKLADGRIEYAVDYFHGLDAIFTRTDALVLTGKVVGDPPVSPAVMTRNFLDDVIAFLRQSLEHDPADACRHHAPQTCRSGDAAYHDMADMFGFQRSSEAYNYPCPLPGAHSVADGFTHFAARLNSFFYGEHPTRVSFYEPAELFGTVQPARTVYAGNYVFRPAALNYFIPFASLRLRMSGPTLGRLVKAELGPRFVSANLPMLHKRTVESGGQSEFRPGIETAREVIDMSGEFERQFYGDVMLFTIEKLAESRRSLDEAASTNVSNTLDAVRTEMLEKYNVRQASVLEKLGTLESLLRDPAHWWNRGLQHAAAVDNFKHFAANIRRNFGTSSAGHLHINAAENWTQWRAALLAAIARYPADRQTWEQVLCAG